MSIEITAIKDNISPTKLRDPGTLRLANINNKSIERTIISNINNESRYLEYVLLISNPANKNKPIDEKLWDNEIKIPLNKPDELKEIIEDNARFRCKIEEKAIIFFKS